MLEGSKLLLELWYHRIVAQIHQFHNVARLSLQHLPRLYLPSQCCRLARHLLSVGWIGPNLRIGQLRLKLSELSSFVRNLQTTDRIEDIGEELCGALFEWLHRSIIPHSGAPALLYGAKHCWPHISQRIAARSLAPLPLFK